MSSNAGSVQSLADTHGLVIRPGTRIWASSDGQGWRSAFASVQREAPFETSCAPVEDHLIVIHLNGPARVTRTLGGRRESALVPPGGSFIMPGRTAFDVRLEAPLETVHFYLRREIVDEIAAELVPGQSDVNIVPGLGKIDPLLEQIAIGLRDQLQEATEAPALYVDHLARAAAARLVRMHSTASVQRRSTHRGGLDVAQLRRAIDYIAANLANDITLPELASESGLSPVYFARQFKLATGLAPHQYLLNSRANQARRLLAVGNLSLAMIALECGFCHQEHFTRVFRKHFGVSPGAYRSLSRF